MFVYRKKRRKKNINKGIEIHRKKKKVVLFDGIKYSSGTIEGCLEGVSEC